MPVYVPSTPQSPQFYRHRSNSSMPNLYEPFLYSTFIQTLLYGIYVATLAHCLRWLLLDDEGWKLRQRINWPMLIISILLFLLSTIDLALTLKFLIAYNLDLLNNLVFDALENATRLIVDGVLIYRCWMVYNKSWHVICLPVVLWLGCLGFTILPYYYGHHSTKLTLRLLGQTYNGTIFFTGHITINIYATSLIVYRILRVVLDNKVTGHARPLYRATRIIAESGILYTLTSIFALIASLPQLFIAPLATAADATNFSTAGIAFNLILIRVGQNRRVLDDTNRLGTQREGQLSTYVDMAT